VYGPRLLIFAVFGLSTSQVGLIAHNAGVSFGLDFRENAIDSLVRLVKCVKASGIWGLAVEQILQFTGGNFEDEGGVSSYLASVVHVTSSLCLVDLGCLLTLYR